MWAYCYSTITKRVIPVGIGEILQCALVKLVLLAVGNQAKTACGNIQICAGLEAGIEGVTHAIKRLLGDKDDTKACY